MIKQKKNKCKKCYECPECTKKSRRFSFWMYSWLVASLIIAISVLMTSNQAMFGNGFIAGYGTLFMCGVIASLMSKDYKK